MKIIKPGKKPAGQVFVSVDKTVGKHSMKFSDKEHHICFEACINLSCLI